MKIVLRTFSGDREYLTNGLSDAQVAALRSLDLTTWIAYFVLPLDRTLRAGKPGPWSLLAADGDGGLHGFRLELDGTIVQARPRPTTCPEATSN